jgi:phage shock protein PspC (stress-responsive transcriptional regulator)
MTNQYDYEDTYTDVPAPEKRKRTDEKRLYKAEKRGEISGVSVGLADYLNIDVTLIRLLFVIFALSGGPGLLVYIILWIIMPDEADLYPERYDAYGNYLGA